MNSVCNFAVTFLFFFISTLLLFSVAVGCILHLLLAIAHIVHLLRMRTTHINNFIRISPGMAVIVIALHAQRSELQPSMLHVANACVACHKQTYRLHETQHIIEIELKEIVESSAGCWRETTTCNYLRWNVNAAIVCVARSAVWLVAEEEVAAPRIPPNRLAANAHRPHNINYTQQFLHVRMRGAAATTAIAPATIKTATIRV